MGLVSNASRNYEADNTTMGTEDARKTVLIVDDDDSILFVLSSALEVLSSQCRVVTARKAEQALACLQNTNCDLVITDLVMPGMKGQELTAHITELSPDLPIIWITAHRSIEVEAEARRYRVYDCLDKPISLVRLREIVPEALGLVGESGRVSAET